MRVRVRKDAAPKAVPWSLRAAATLPRGARVSNPLLGERAEGTYAVLDHLSAPELSIVSLLKRAQPASGALLVLDQEPDRELLDVCGYTPFRIDGCDAFFAANYGLPSAPWLHPLSKTDRVSTALLLDPVQPTAKLLVKTTKADATPEERFILGVVLEPDEVDSQGDTISAEEIRHAAHKYMEDYGNVGLQHQVFVNGKVKILESYICPCDCVIGGQNVKAGTWLMAFRICCDAIWEAVKTGLLTGLSIGGLGSRVPA